MAENEEIVPEEEPSVFLDVVAAPFRGVEGALQGVYNLADYLAFDVLPDYDTRFLGKSKTMAGGAIEGITQFVVPFGGLFKAAGLAGKAAKAGSLTKKAFTATAPKAVITGAATDFTFFNGQEARLSNLIQQVPELQNPVTEFLAYDSDEGEIEGRLKNVLEGLGLEAMAGVFIKSLRSMKEMRKAKDTKADALEVEEVGRKSLEEQKAFEAKEEEVLEAPKVEEEVDLPKVEGEEIDGIKPLETEITPVPKKPKPIIEFTPGKTDEFIDSVPDKWKDWTKSVIDGKKPSMPRLEVGEDIDSAHKILSAVYKADPEKQKRFTQESEIDFGDDQLTEIMKTAANVTKKQQEVRVFQEVFKDTLKGVSDNVMDAVKEFEATESLQSEAKLRNHLQEFLEVYDYYRQLGRETSLTLAMRREKAPISRKVGLSNTDIKETALVRDFLNKNSGSMPPKKAVKLLKDMFDPSDRDGTIRKFLNFSKKAQGKSMLDMTIEFWVNSILSGPKTQMVNALGNFFTQALGTAELAIGGLLSGNPAVAKAAIASRADYAMIKEAWSSAGTVFKQGEEMLDVGRGTMEGEARRAITSQNVELLTGKKLSDPMKKAIDNMSAWGVNLPAKGLLGTDQLFKYLAFRRAARVKATMDALSKGIKEPKKLAEYVEGMLNKVTTQGGAYMSQETLIREASKLADSKELKGASKSFFIKKYVQDNFDEDASALAQYAIEESRYFTHTRELEEGTIGKSIEKAKNNHAALKLVMPFVRTPANLLSFALERSPLSIPIKVPGTNKIITTPGLKSEAEGLMQGMKSSDPVVRAQTYGKFATMASMVGIWYQIAQDNAEFITGGGPRDEKKKAALMATGWRPYSIKIGDTYYSYQRLDPIASILGIAADVVETGKASERGFGESHLEHMTIALITSLSRNAANKSYLAGVQLWANALEDPERFGERLGRNYASSFVPNVISQMQDYDTQAMREVRSVGDAILRKWPNGREQLDPRRNLLGEETMIEAGGIPVFSAFNPIAKSTDKKDPVMDELASLNYAFRMPDPSEKNINLLDYTNQAGRTAHDRRLDLLQSVRIEGKTLRQALNSLIKSANYQRLERETFDTGFDSPRVQEITKVLRRYRKQAKKEMLREFPELAGEIDNMNRAQARLRTGMQREDVLALLTQ